jgi:saccharopine dehydrogenase-like NADP-dependent oxidoreductase
MKILVLGAGRMGHGAAFDLIYNSPTVEAVTIADYDVTKAERIAADINHPKIKTVRIDVSDYTAGARLMRGHDAAISCVNY